MLTTFMSLSVTNSGFSPASMHFFAQAACSGLAPLAPHLESLIQPFQLMSFAAVSTVMLIKQIAIIKSTRLVNVEPPVELAADLVAEFYEPRDGLRKIGDRAKGRFVVKRDPPFALQTSDPSRMM